MPATEPPAGHMVTHMRRPSLTVQYPLAALLAAVMARVAAAVELVVLVFMASSFGEIAVIEPNTFTAIRQRNYAVGQGRIFHLQLFYFYMKK